MLWRENAPLNVFGSLVVFWLPTIVRMAVE